VQLPVDLRDWLKHKAIDNRQSFGAEVAGRLERTRQQDKHISQQAPTHEGQQP
jgi:hypothetical protein